MSPGATVYRLPRLTAVVIVLCMVMLLTPWDVGTVARAQSLEDLRADQTRAEQAEEAAREAQAGVAEELQGAVQDRQAVQSDLTQATLAVDQILTEVDAVVGEQRALRVEVARLEVEAEVARASLAGQIRELYMQGGASDVVLAMDAEGSSRLSDRSHYLSALSRADRGELEQLDVVTTTLQGRREELALVDQQLAGLRDEARGRQQTLETQLLIAAGVEQSVAADLSQAEADARELASVAEEAEQAVSQAEEAGREAARQAAAEAARKAAAAAAEAAAATAAATARANAARAATVADAAAQSAVGPSGGDQPAPAADDAPPADAPAAANASGKTCPQDNPRSFTDTWGAPRSGGRSHKGTDIFGARGGRVFALTSGTITRTSGGNLSGLFMILRGDDGNDYWYLHLQDFVASSGQRVSVGEVIAHNGDTGNARGTTPHIHFELHPGGGGAVNPYSLLASIC